MTLARQLLEAMDEEIVQTMVIRAGTKGIDFDTSKSVTLKAGEYELISVSKDGISLVADRKGNLFYVDQ